MMVAVVPVLMPVIVLMPMAVMVPMTFMRWGGGNRFGWLGGEQRA